MTPSSHSKGSSRWTIGLALAAALAAAIWLALAPWPQLTLATTHAAAMAKFDRARLERRAEHALALWQQARAAPDETDDAPADVDLAQPADAHDGLYTGTALMRAEGGTVTFKIKVTNGIGSGMQRRLDCSTAPMALRITPAGEVRGLALVFSSTCIKTELAVRGRVASGVLMLRLGSQYVELSKWDD